MNYHIKLIDHLKHNDRQFLKNWHQMNELFSILDNINIVKLMFYILMINLNENLQTYIGVQNNPNSCNPDKVFFI